MKIIVEQPHESFILDIPAWGGADDDTMTGVKHISSAFKQARMTETIDSGSVLRKADNHKGTLQ